MEEKPIRILQYIGGLGTGGSQAMIMEIYRKIDKEKIQFDFIVDRKNELYYKNEILKLGRKIYTFDEYLKGINYFKFKKQWYTFFKEHKEYNIIHCHVRSVASIVLKIAKKYGLKTICHSHNTSNGKGIKSIAKKILQSRIPKYSDYLFACSTDSAKWLYGKKYLKSERCKIINNAIDTQKYIFNETKRNEIRKKLNLEDKIIIGQVGRLEKVKNYEFTIELLKSLMEIDKNYFLLIIGNGSRKKDLLNKISALGLDNNVLFLENRNDVNELMLAMDIFIMPSLYEGLPLALIEAQASCLPCIISNKIKSGIIINDLVKKIDLDKKNLWIKEINNTKNVKRYDTSKIIIKNNFDISKNAKYISELYLNL